MAWPEDKKEPYRMKPSPLMQRANKTTGEAFKSAATVADKYAGGAGARMIGGAVAGAVGKIASDAQANTVARQVRRKEIPYGDQAQRLDQFRQRIDNRQYGSTAPQINTAPSQDIGERARKKLSENANNVIIPSSNSSQRSRQFNSVRGQVSGTRPIRVGNMDVTFDPSVSPEARARFMADPVRPTAQINRQRGFNIAPPLPQDNRISSIGARIGARKDRLARDQMALDKTKTDIDRSRVDSENALRDMQIKEGGLSLGRAEMISDMQSRYLNPDTPDTEKQQIADQLRFLSGDKTEYKPITIDQYDDKGFQTGQQVKAFDPRTGQVIGGQQEQDPVMSVINSNPQYRKVFEGSSYEERQRIIKQIQERLNLR